ncbi:MAG TPA: hypothetical protein VIL84_13800 [Devosiaceae bacterium]
MSSDVLLAGFLIAVGLSVAGAGTHLYQGLARQQAELRYDGRTVWGMFGNLFMSFVCGPYIMLQMGARAERGGTVALTPIVLSAFVAFGWSFITGLLFVSVYLAMLG